SHPTLTVPSVGPGEDLLGQQLTSPPVSLEGLGCSAMARTLPEDDQAWSEVDRGEEPPERVTLPVWLWLALAVLLAFYLRSPLAGLLAGPALGTWTTTFFSLTVQ